ncbi:MAG: ISKra4 family transposase, partial [Pseudanabaena sp.]
MLDSLQQPLSPIFTCLGDGYDGVWRLTSNFGGSLVSIRREVLDWFHLVENLHKVQMLPSMQKWVEHLLWHGAVESALRFLSPIKQHQSQ